MGTMTEFELVRKAITALSIELEALTGLRLLPKGATLQVQQVACEQQGKSESLS